MQKISAAKRKERQRSQQRLDEAIVEADKAIRKSFGRLDEKATKAIRKSFGRLDEEIKLADLKKKNKFELK